MAWVRFVQDCPNCSRCKLQDWPGSIGGNIAQVGVIGQNLCKMQVRTLLPSCACNPHSADRLIVSDRLIVPYRLLRCDRRMVCYRHMMCDLHFEVRSTYEECTTYDM